MSGVQPASHFAYDYTVPKQYCEQLGLLWDERALTVADPLFDKLELRQHQVDELVKLYAWNMKHYFTPSNYGLKQRIALAFHFLFG